MIFAVMGKGRMMMGRCNECLHEIVCEFHHNFNGIDTRFCNYFKNKADVQEVKHGKWKQIEDSLGWQEVRCAECSVCGEDWIIEEDYSFEDFTEYWRYCPNCGAKMDGGKSG